jgi:threonine/homoserine/homoserine lactone efflux protein
MVLGILGFFTVVALVVTVVAEVRGEPALNEAIVLAGFVLLTYLAYRAWQRSD